MPPFSVRAVVLSMMLVLMACTPTPEKICRQNNSQEVNPLLSRLLKIRLSVKRIKSEIAGASEVVSAAVIAISTILFFDYGALAGSYKQDSKMTKCQNNLGEVVVFINGNSDKQKPAAGMAKRDENGQPIVVRFNYASAPVELQQFIDFHECAHHQVGDIDRPHPPRNSYEHLMNESIADCIAILMFRDDEESTYKSYKNLIASLEKDMENIGFPVISISSRMSNISNCYKDYESAKSFISGVLEKRSLE